jgi:hypothetical protein
MGRAVQGLMELVEREILDRDLGVTFDDIAALDTAKRLLREALVLPLIVPEFFTGIREPWKVRPSVTEAFKRDCYYRHSQAAPKRGALLPLIVPEFFTGIREPWKVRLFRTKPLSELCGCMWKSLGRVRSGGAGLFTAEGRSFGRLTTRLPPQLTVAMCRKRVCGVCVWSPGRAAVRPPWHGQDDAGQGGGGPLGLYLLQLQRRHTGTPHRLRRVQPMTWSGIQGESPNCLSGFCT